MPPIPKKSPYDRTHSLLSKPIVKECGICKKQFTCKLWVDKGRKYCTKTCRSRAANLSKERYLLKPKRIKCRMCYKDFQFVARSSVAKRKYCGECTNKAKSEKKKKAKNPNWRGGVNFSKAYYEHLEDIGYDTSEQGCERCSRTDQPRYEVHHIVYRSECRNHPEKHNIRNLIYLCAKCHNWYHQDKKRRATLLEARKLYELFEHINQQNTFGERIKLDIDMAREIRELYEKSDACIAEIARKYDMGETTISGIVKGNIWKE